jgi:hypothetical protein
MAENKIRKSKDFRSTYESGVWLDPPTQSDVILSPPSIGVYGGSFMIDFRQGILDVSEKHRSFSFFPDPNLDIKRKKVDIDRTQLLVENVSRQLSDISKGRLKDWTTEDSSDEELFFKEAKGE